MSLISRFFEWFGLAESAFFAAPATPEVPMSATIDTRWIEIAESFIGCDAEHEPSRFCTVVCPNGPADIRKEFCRNDAPNTRNSSCKDTAVGFYAMRCRELGIATVAQRAGWVADEWAHVEADARAAGALLAPTLANVRAGCILHLESSAGRHWRNVVEDLGGGRFRCVDGGDQNEHKYQRIHETTTQLQQRGAVLWDVSSAKPVTQIVDLNVIFAAAISSPGTQNIPAVLPPVSPATSVTSTDSRPRATTNIPGNIPLQFIDLSDANYRPKPPDFVAIKAAGVTGVWFHALEGNEDPAKAIAKLMFEVNRARAAGLLTGAYQEVYPRHDGHPSDAETQAQQLAEVTHGLACELLPMAVHEDVTNTAKSYDATKKAECVEFARQHRAALTRELGREGIFYTGPGYWDHVSKGLDVSDFHDALLMCADYEDRTTPLVPHGFDRVTLWQYAGGAGVIGKVPGVWTAVDRTRQLVGGLGLIRA